MKQLTIAFVMGILAFAAPASFANEGTDGFYQIASVEMTEVVPTAEEIAAGYVEAGNLQALIDDLTGIDWDAMIRIGKEIIEIIKANRPVVNIKRDAVAVLPLGVQNWQDLTGWQMPATKVYNVAMKNLWGVTVVSLRLKVSGMYGGNINGRGKYLANVVIVPSQVYVMWGFDLDLWSENREPVNAGSTAQPMAGLGFDIRYRVKNAMNELNGTKDYFITGDGQIREVQ